MPRAVASRKRRTDLSRIPRRSDLKYTDRFSVEKLSAFRICGDPLADDVANELHERHGGLTKIHDLLTTVRAKAAECTGPEGDVFRKFLAESARVPDWADREMIERGQRVHTIHTPFIGLSLFAGSLVGGAQYPVASVVTVLAGNITTDPLRRLNETGSLLQALAFPGSLVDAGCEAHESLTKVRLLHAALRNWLPRSGRLQRLPEIVPSRILVEGEVPINQQDLAITLGVFCYINLRSMRRMNIILSSQDIVAYVQMWRYAGYVLGIHNDLLPETLEAQEEFMLASMLHQGVPDFIDGDATKKFINTFAQAANTGTKGLLSFERVQDFLFQMIVYLNGAEHTTGMEIEDKGDTHWSVRFVRTFGFLFGTAMPRLPLGETALFHLHQFGIRRQQRLRGTPVGHGAGTGADVSRSVGTRPPPARL
eukprot:CAMPEP_0204276970 /NCGR_PEP_ID=MMETSP0468-20130131/29033_1 /ASSEMBLY_ACC=CAM_ASM_000383 /TAXON_ID=2969 /ORGANISM="Oxyrrhis marina" /LENGTH=423 /DNA_ID=CAMNT_0051253679 /DNA_START=26 /DNA_END=1297 /DNA_ORIENTATION=+